MSSRLHPIGTKCKKKLQAHHKDRNLELKNSVLEELNLSSTELNFSTKRYQGRTDFVLILWRENVLVALKNALKMY